MTVANKVITLKTKQGNRVDMELTTGTEHVGEALKISFSNTESFWNDLSDRIDTTTIVNLSDTFVATIDAYYDEEADEPYLHAIIERKGNI